MTPETKTRQVLRRRAFGLDVEGDFFAPGLVQAPPTTDRPTHVTVVDEAEVDATWPEGARVLLEEHDDEGAVARTILHKPGVGYRLCARHFGLARISDDGREILCAPPGEIDWRWQRFLVGRVLPYAATIQGVELLHASAVAIGDRAVAISGPSGSGKTSLAAHLILLGGRFVSDDVLALEPNGDEILAHPGPATASIRSSEHRLLTREERARLGDALGESAKIDFAVSRVEEPLHLGALYFLRRGPTTDGPVLRQMTRPQPQALLGNTFIDSLRSPQRLIRQLDLYSRVASAVPAYEVAVSPATTAREVARQILDVEGRR